MPTFQFEPLPYEPDKDLTLNWDNFRGGLNTLLRETEVEDNELVEAENLMLVGAGVPTKRWGLSNYFLANATGSVRGLKGYYTTALNQLLCITDQGYLTKKSGASYAMIAGASWASGYDASMTQLDNDIYIVNGQREMVRYSSPTLAGFPTIAIPTGVLLTQISGASGTNTYAYRVSSVSNVGETLASTSVELVNQPQTLLDGTIKVSWTGTSTASGILKGYNIYGRELGDERFLGSVDAGSVNWLDSGAADPREFTYPPTADSTGGINAKYVIRFEDRLVFAGLDDDPSKVVISGRVPHHEKFDLSYGGNYIRIEPDAGDDITGLAVFERKIIVFKERSIWQITLSSLQIGNFYVWIPTAQLITASHGCIAPKTIKHVENDIFFLTRKGVYTLGYEPNVLSVLRTNEISAKVRPFFTDKTTAQLKAASAFYHDFKYGLAFPGTNKSIIYDRERLAWMGPWTFDANVFDVYTDSNDNERLLLGKDTSPDVWRIDEDYADDNGAAIATALKTKRANFGDWSRFKFIKDVYVNLEEVKGNIDIEPRIEERDGGTIITKSFTIVPAVGNSGWGADQWANTLWADSEEYVGDVEVKDTVRWVRLNKRGRNLQLIINTSGKNAVYKLLGFQALARPLGKITRGANWTV